MSEKATARRRPMQAKRTQTPIRYRKARADATVGGIVARIAKKFGLPVGALRIVHPDGRKIRSDATVAKLKEIWDA